MTVLCAKGELFCYNTCMQRLKARKPNHLEDPEEAGYYRLLAGVVRQAQKDLRLPLRDEAHPSHELPTPIEKSDAQQFLSWAATEFIP